MLADDLLEISLYRLSDEEKREKLLPSLVEAAAHHYDHCRPYQNWCSKQGFDPHIGLKSIFDLPYLPVDLFKRVQLLSVPEQNVLKMLTSSATTTGIPSIVPIDRVTSRRQNRALVAVLQDFLGPCRYPFVVMDEAPHRGRNSSQISARGAALRGFLMAASNTIYCLREDREGKLRIDLDTLVNTLSSFEKIVNPFYIFGFTYILYGVVVRQIKEHGLRFNLKHARVIHIGGWKKLKDQQVTKEQFNEELSSLFGCPTEAIIDIYGFTEQIGLIYPDCSAGYKHMPVFSEIIVRNPESLKPAPDWEEGLIQIVTPIPYSYPGISVITDDVGRVVGRGRCNCGRYGTAFEIVGRAEKAEARGCGDMLADRILPVSVQ